MYDDLNGPDILGAFPPGIVAFRVGDALSLSEFAKAVVGGGTGGDRPGGDRLFGGDGRAVSPWP